MTGKGIIKSAVSTATGGGKFGVNQYTTDLARRAMGLAYATYADGHVRYFARPSNVIKRAVIQTVSQAAYGTLRSYPRYIKYYEAKKIAERVSKSQTSLANPNSKYYELLKTQTNFTEAVEGEVQDKSQAHKIKLVAGKRVRVAEDAKMEPITGRPVMDYLKLSISESDYNLTRIDATKSFTEEFNIVRGDEKPDPNKGLVIELIDMHAKVQVSTKNNIKQTVVVGRDYSRKELISGGDLEITVSGKLTSKYPDIYPESEVQKFIKLMQYKGVLKCYHTVLKQFNISQIIVTGFSMPTSEGIRNVQDYSFTCLAVEPDTPAELKLREQEQVERALEEENAKTKWTHLVKYGSQLVDPTILLNLTQVWL